PWSHSSAPFSACAVSVRMPSAPSVTAAHRKSSAATTISRRSKKGCFIVLILRSCAVPASFLLQLVLLRRFFGRGGLLGGLGLYLRLQPRHLLALLQLLVFLLKADAHHVYVHADDVQPRH